MMEANELRIGNHVLFKGTEIKLLGSYDLFKACASLRHGDSDYEPVKLTVALLTEMGFIEVDAKAGTAAAYKRSGIRIELSNSGNFYYKGTPIPYVHLIQNLYFFSEGDEVLELS